MYEPGVSFPSPDSNPYYGTHSLILLKPSNRWLLHVPPRPCMHALTAQGKIGQTVFLSLLIGLIYLHISSSYTGVQDRQVTAFTEPPALIA